MAIVLTGVQGGKTYGARSPMWLRFASNAIGEKLVDVTLSVFVWQGHKTTDKPGSPNYTLYRDSVIFGSNAASTEFNLASFAREELDIQQYQNSYATNWSCWVSVSYEINYLDGVGDPQVTNGVITMIATNGYSYFDEGDNIELMPYHFPTDSINILQGSNLQLTFLDTRVAGSPALTINSINYSFNGVTGGTLDFGTASSLSNGVFKRLDLYFPFSATYCTITSDDDPTLNFRINAVCRKKYGNSIVGYVDKNGVISYAPFRGNFKESENFTREERRRFLGSNRGVRGQLVNYNINSTQDLTLNSDWVNEDFREIIRELELTEYAFYKSQSSEVLDYFGRVLNDGGEVVERQCVLNALLSYGLGLDATNYDAVITESAETPVLVTDSSKTYNKLIDGLINYEVNFKKAFNSINTFR